MNRLSRRGILGGAAALVPAATVGVGVSPTFASPDAELIAACDQHIRNLLAVNADDSPAAFNDEHPMWQAYHATYVTVRDGRPQTLAGVVAKARAAKAEASVPPGEEEDTSDWAGIVVRDLLRLADG